MLVRTTPSERHVDMNDKDKRDSGIESRIAELRDKNGMTRERAREHLVALGVPAIPWLVPLLEDRESQTRWEAAKALAEIADPSAIPALIQALEDEENDVSWVAAEGLAAVGRPAVVPMLEALVQGEGSIKIRQGVHHALRGLRDSEVGEKIAGVYGALGTVGSDVGIVAEAERALASLKSGR
jgi:HEAT repeat protein